MKSGVTANSWEHLLVLVIGIALGGMSVWTYWLWQENQNPDFSVVISDPTGEVRSVEGALRQAQEENRLLAQQAEGLLIQLNSLSSQIEELRQALGLPPSAKVEGQGGLGTTPTASLLLSYAQQEANLVGLKLNGRIIPLARRRIPGYGSEFPASRPIDGEYRITSLFGLRSNPFGKGGYELHDGMDFAAVTGTRVYATGPGQVAVAGWSNIYGNHVIIEHAGGYRTLYGHLSKIETATGREVRRGELIGRVGSTGRSTGPHLHYGVSRYDEPRDPRAFLPSY
jgi:murein DD-endopeptidase MepM/ murein hydrolase activator NlpD